MKVVVLGANGFLGGAVADRLRERHAVVAVGRRAGVDRWCDLADLSALTALLDDERPDAVVNAAVVADFAPGALPALVTVNVLVPGVVATWCQRNGGHLVHASATLVHGARTGEVSPLSPILADTDYGRSKLLADDLIDAAGCDATLIRFGGIFGLGGPSHLGLNSALTDAAAGRTPVLRGTGTGRRNYLHVVDGAAAVEAVLERRLLGIHYAAGAEVLTIRTMLEVVCDVFGIAGPDIEDGGPGADQIVERSPSLPEPRSFRAAVEHDRDR